MVSIQLNAIHFNKYKINSTQYMHTHTYITDFHPKINKIKCLSHRKYILVMKY